MTVTLISYAFLPLSLCFGFVMWRRSRNAAQLAYIRSYMFPDGLLAKFAQHNGDVALKDSQLVARALRQFFLAYHKSGFRYVSMPSRIVDELWHEFILYTRNYEYFCRKAFGRYLHHTPAAVLNSGSENNKGLRRVWWHACIEENINPRRPTRLPLLFALDEKLHVPDGFFYTPDCKALHQATDRPVYCATEFASKQRNDGGAGCGGGSCGSSGDASGCSSGCSGGCGGGCGS